MSDPTHPNDPYAASEPPPAGAPEAAAAEPEYPWDTVATPADPDAPRERHDAFTETRKCAFLRALAKTGCVLDTCRSTGVAPRTFYRHQESDGRFAGHVRAALAMASTPVELLAWQRAVEGVEQPFACGGEVHVRRRYSDGLLRLLLQGTNPKKYGPNPGFGRKRLTKWEKKRIERDVRAEIAASGREWTFEEAIMKLDQRLRALNLRSDDGEDRTPQGWTRSPEGHWVPPGYAPIPGWTPPPIDAALLAAAEAAEAAEKDPPESV